MDSGINTVAEPTRVKVDAAADSAADATFEPTPNGVVPAHRVALVHDWLTGMRGGEMVLEELCRLFPRADLFTIAHLKGTVSPTIENRRIVESPLVKLPNGRRYFRSLLPLFPWAVETFDLKGYDLVISSSHCAAKGVIPAPDALHVAYIHTPMRYVWDLRDEYLGQQRLGGLTRLAAGVASHYLRNWDSTSSTRVDYFIANSQHVARRVRKYYRRDVTVIYPPVDTELFKIADVRRDYFLVVGALVPYKRVDLAIEACNRLGVRLIIAGDGSEKKRLERLAGSAVEFIGPQTLDQLVTLYQGALALIHPGEEDFGIVPVEAQACGRPVIAYARGGVTETVVGGGEHPSGAFFSEQTVESLVQALKMFAPGSFNPADARANALRFSRSRFVGELRAYLRRCWNEVRSEDYAL